MQSAIPIQTNAQRRELKSLKALRLLALIETILAILLIVLEGTVDGMASVHSRWWHLYSCSLGTGVWVGAFGVIAGAFGLASFRTKYGNRCFTMAHFVLSIIAAVADAVLITLASFCMLQMNYSFKYSLWDSHRTPPPESSQIQNGLIATESLLLIFAFVHLICCIISTAFVCRNWSTNSSAKALTVVYLPRPSDGPTSMIKDGQPISVPAGTQVVFIPTTKE